MDIHLRKFSDMVYLVRSFINFMARKGCNYVIILAKATAKTGESS